MKRIFAVIVSFFVMFSAVAAAAQTSIISEIYSNYTSEYSFSMEFESSEEVVALLEEIGAFYEESMIIDPEPFLKSILSMDAKMKMTFDMSDDMKVIKAAVEADSSHIVDVNTNLSASIAAKAGIWINMDFSDEKNPVYEVIYSSPVMNKYLVIDVFKEISAEEKEEIISIKNKFLNKEFIETMQNFLSELVSKHAKIRTSYGKCVVKIDNAALIKIIEDMLPFIADKVSSAFDMESREYKNTVSEISAAAKNIDLSDIKLLGDKGLTCTYILKNKKLSAIEENVDVCIDIAGIYEAVSGEEWIFDSRGSLNFKINSTAVISKKGTTAVSFPNLTPENSIDFSQLYETEDYEGYEDFADYPRYYICGFCEKLPVIDDNIYVPLRKTIEAAFDDNAQITYNNGVITLESEYFPGFKSLTLYNGSDKAYTENGEYPIAPIIIEDGVTYVNSKLFEEIFGWSFSGANLNVLTKEYFFEFSNYPEEEQIPPYWVGCSCDFLPDSEDGEVYVPLRRTIEEAYGEFAQITYDNGKITLESEYFPGFTKLTFSIGESKAYTDAGEFDTGAVITENSLTYVNRKFFENIFGWELTYMQYDMFEKTWQYEFLCY